MDYQIITIDPENDIRWDKFLEDHPQSSIYHHSSWLKFIVDTFNHKPVFVAIEDEGKNLKGILPFVIIKNLFGKQRAISLPFATHCDILVPCKFVESVITFTKENFNIDNFDFKLNSVPEYINNNFNTYSNYFRHVLNLDAPIEEVFSNFHRSCVRGCIKQSMKKDLNLNYVEDERGLRLFFDLELGIRKNLGFPSLPYKFFVNMWLALKPNDMIEIPVIENQGKVIAAAIVLKFKDTYILEYAASDYSKLDLRPNHRLYWEIIQKAHKNNIKYIDFGRTSKTNESLRVFKERWNAERSLITHATYSKLNSKNKDKGDNKLLKSINSIMPEKVIELEGKIIYPRRG